MILCIYRSMKFIVLLLLLYYLLYYVLFILKVTKVPNLKYFLKVAEIMYTQ